MKYLNFRVGQSLGESEYMVLDGQKPSLKKGVARPIARGKAGIVYRVEYRGLQRALKLLIPESFRGERSSGQGDDTEWVPYLKTFKSEITLLSKITHTNIAKLVDHSTTKIDGIPFDVPYYVMELVEGPEFLDALEKEQYDYDTILSLYGDVASALAFLHQRQIMHADVKSPNIRLDLTGSRPRAILLDLGVAKVLGDPDDPKFPGLDPNSRTYFFSTRSITRKDRQAFLHQPIPVRTLKSWFPDHDLYGLGLLLGAGLDLPHVRTTLLHALREAGFSALELTQKRLTEDGRESRYSIETFKEALRKVNPDYMSPMGIPELSFSVDPKRSILLPEARVHLGDRFLKLVDTPAIQRLRHLKQLSLVYLGWPGARHSRYAYTLQCLQTAREYLSNLLDDARFRLMVSRADVEAALIYSLVKEIGHYPLAHVFEEIRDSQPSAEKGRGFLPLDKELARYVLFHNEVQPNRRLEEIGDALKAVKCPGNRRLNDLTDVIRDSFDPSCLASLSKIATHDVKSEVGRLLVGLFDSPIDVSKVTYLRMDSVMTGVDFGKGIDLAGLLANLTVPRDRELEIEVPMMALYQRGLASAESAILARYWMIQKVYWSTTNRALMAQVMWAIEVLRKYGFFDFKHYITNCILGSHEDALRYLEELWSGKRKKLEKELGERVICPMAGLTDGSRIIYRRLISIDKQRREKYSSAHPQREDELIYDAIAAKIGVKQEIQEKIRRKLAKLLPSAVVPHGSVLLDIPPKGKEETGGQLWIYSPERQEVKDVFAACPMLKELETEFTYFTKKIRVFISPDLAEALESAGKLDNARTTAKNVLRAQKAG